MKNASGELSKEDLDFVYFDADCNDMKLHLLIDIVYMIDYDIVRMLPELYNDLDANLKIPECFPGGKMCMMNAVCTFYALQLMLSNCLPSLHLMLLLQVTQSARPFMGPNLYMTRKSLY